MLPDAMRCTQTVPRSIVMVLVGCAVRPPSPQTVAPREASPDADAPAAAVTEEEQFDTSTHFVAERDGFVVVQPAGCELSNAVEHIRARESDVEISVYRCQAESVALQIGCLETSVLGADWTTDLNALLGGPEPTMHEPNALWPETAIHLERDGDAASRSLRGVAFRQPGRTCRLLVAHAVSENGSTARPTDVSRVTASFLSTAAARRAMDELPDLPRHAVAPSALDGKLAALEVADGTLYLDRVEDEKALDRARERHGSAPVLLYDLHAKRGPKTYGKSVTILFPATKHALLDAFQLERVVPHYGTLLAEEFTFREVRDASFGELAEVHTVTSPLSTPELSAAAAFVRCGVFVNVTSWSGDTGGAANLVIAVARAIDEVIRATSCAS